MVVQPHGATRNMTDLVASIPMVMAGQILTPTGRPQAIVTKPMHSQTIQLNGAMKTATALEATSVETTQTSAQTKQVPQLKTALVALTETVTGTQTQAIHSPTTQLSGLTEMETTAAITRTETTRMRSLMTPPNGRTPTEMAVAITRMDSMATHFGKIQTSGKTAMAMATVTISSTKTAMAFPKAIRMCVRLCSVSQPMH